VTPRATTAAANDEKVDCGYTLGRRPGGGADGGESLNHVLGAGGRAGDRAAVAGEGSPTSRRNRKAL